MTGRPSKCLVWQPTRSIYLRERYPAIVIISRRGWDSPTPSASAVRWCDPRAAYGLFSPAVSLDVHLGGGDGERRPGGCTCFSSSADAPGRPAAVPDLSSPRSFRAPPGRGFAAQATVQPQGDDGGVGLRRTISRSRWVQQTSLSVEKEIGTRTAVGAVNYLYVHGMHLIRAPRRRTCRRAHAGDLSGSRQQSGANLPTNTVNSFSTWQMTRSLTCSFPPCINPLARPFRNSAPSMCSRAGPPACITA